MPVIVEIYYTFLKKKKKTVLLLGFLLADAIFQKRQVSKNIAALLWVAP